jgi:hypothetical protein
MLACSLARFIDQVILQPRAFRSGPPLPLLPNAHHHRLTVISHGSVSTHRQQSRPSRGKHVWPTKAITRVSV